MIIVLQNRMQKYVMTKLGVCAPANDSQSEGVD